MQQTKGHFPVISVKNPRMGCVAWQLLFASLTIALAFVGMLPGARAADGKPNILYIVADDLAQFLRRCGLYTLIGKSLQGTQVNWEPADDDVGDSFSIHSSLPSSM